MRILRLVIAAHLLLGLALLQGCSQSEPAPTKPVDPKLEGTPAARKQGVMRPVPE